MMPAPLDPAIASTDPDIELERRIDAVRRRLLRAEPDRLALWNELAALIKQRSPQQVERMEREQGLR